MKPYIMQILRMRKGLEPDDPSKDHILVKTNPVKVVRELSAWKLGSSDWADTFAKWIVDAETTAKEIYEDMINNL